MTVAVMPMYTLMIGFPKSKLVSGAAVDQACVQVALTRTAFAAHYTSTNHVHTPVKPAVKAKTQQW